MPQLQNLNETVVFAYMGKTYSGYVVSSTDLDPHFHWFFFNDKQFAEQFSDSIAFREINGSLRPVHNYSRNAELVLSVQKAVEAYLIRQRHVQSD